MARALDACAKVNLFLAVRGRRPDGYHEIETILHEVTLHDTLVATVPGGVAGGTAGAADRDIALVVHRAAIGTGLPVAANADNLVCRAARAFFAATGIAGGAQFHLTKRIPAGGGLGGGSSDAAAALRLLNDLHGEPIDAAGMHALAVGLGADVPFFLRGGTQRAAGTGTELTRLSPQPPLHFVLILPPGGTSTAAIYKNHRARLIAAAGGPSIRGDRPPLPANQETALSSGFPNDLEATALQLHPELASLRAGIAAAGCPDVRMSGSGSAFFLAFPEAPARDAALDRLAHLRAQGVALVPCASRIRGRDEPRDVAFPGGR